MESPDSEDERNVSLLFKRGIINLIPKQIKLLALYILQTKDDGVLLNAKLLKNVGIQCQQYLVE